MGVDPATEVAAASDTAHSTVGPVESPDRGAHCADGLDAVSLDEFFSQAIGSFGGADYQRVVRLPDDRVLWTFQDAFVDGVLVHNTAMIQSGRCFTHLGGTRSWLLDEHTAHMRRWHWILGAGVGKHGRTVHLFVAEMNETGTRYLDAPRPVALRRIVLDLVDLSVVGVADLDPTGDDLYGWSVTSDDQHTYLYSHCYQQFGFDTLFGFADCVRDVKVARIPRGDFDAPPEFWDGTGWSGNHADAVPVIDGTFVASGNNPAQVMFDGDRFVVVEKRDDWWGRSVEFGTSAAATGPFVHRRSEPEPLRCERERCNSYFASWIPWTDDAGRLIWAIGHNRWDGSETAEHLADYRPSFHTIEARDLDG